MHIFQRHGIKNLTMEDMLAQLGISKGTLQGIAKTKEALLDQCVDAALTRRMAHFAGLLEVAANPVEALMQLLHANLKALAGHHPSFLPDMKTAYPGCWLKTQEFSNNYLQGALTSQVIAAKEQELLKPEIKAPLVSQLLIAQTYAIVETNVLNEKENNFGVVFKLAIEYYLRGLLTEKGLQLLDKITSPKASDEVLDTL
ncbi:TetR/AcrR family transcriptional regulator [Adhaeribacter sp. BT258]|uniref:TetR/AcrR family transcriptional regulator n=1 Tax=Adhaeribacter terrigena TaxID=2793070 RepID=A0ABS1BYM2_9BACT|nr:TetR/AcrR family transcriptional regulator [Adhaeribacter terrigena]MBK0402007.1 TetR/AcrR family transcriptional regulator [Adhaeribacter terrigena]